MSKHDFWYFTLTFDLRPWPKILAKVKVDPHAKYQCQRSKASAVRVLTDRHEYKSMGQWFAMEHITDFYSKHCSRGSAILVGPLEVLLNSYIVPDGKNIACKISVLVNTDTLHFKKLFLKHPVELFSFYYVSCRVSNPWKVITSVLGVSTLRSNKLTGL